MIKKQLIMEKAIELFAKQGFEATTVQQITDYCGISKGAFYLSFKSKDELILALIDHFMVQITSDIDYIVRNSNKDVLLYDFYFKIYQTYQKHSDFAKIFVKDQTYSFNNEEFFKKINYYDRLLDESILLMLELLYGEAIDAIKYDLIYCIKGFMKTYAHLFLFYSIPVDIELLAKSLAEKTNLLANHTTISFLSQDQIDILKQPLTENITKDGLLEIIDQKIAEMEESIEKESLVLLRGQLVEPTLNRAIVIGLLENIRNNPHCKWIAYLLRGNTGMKLLLPS